MWQFESIFDTFTATSPISAAQLNSNEVMAELIRDTLQDFQARGIPVNPSSRLHQYASLFEKSMKVEGDDKLHGQMDIALLEALQFTVLRRALAAHSECSALTGLIAQATEGNADPIHDRPDCKARSTQFELFLWACLRHAKFDVTPSEPDLIVRTPSGQSLAVAAKRPRSERKLVKNVRSGCRQLDAHNCDGIVAVDLSFVEAVRKPIYIQRAEHNRFITKIMLDGLVLDRRGELIGAAQGSRVIGILFYYSCVVRTLLEGARITSRRWLFVQTREGPISPEARDIIQRLSNLRRYE